jgi:hypothetical protein
MNTQERKRNRSENKREAVLRRAFRRKGGSMEPSMHWLPLTEYALRSGMSISTLRRKIKSNSIEFKMEEGRYLIRSDELADAASVAGFASSDLSPRVPSARPASPMAAQPIPRSELIETKISADEGDELPRLREELRRLQEDNLLRWKALEARVSGLAKKVEMFSEQMAETKMLVKLFEEKLDTRA